MELTDMWKKIKKSPKRFYILLIGLFTMLGIFCGGFDDLMNVYDRFYSKEEISKTKLLEITPKEKTFYGDKNNIYLMLGNILFSYKNKTTSDILKIGEVSIISFKKNENGFYFNSRVFSEDGIIMAKVENNKLIINEKHPEYFYLDDSNAPSEITIFDIKDRRVLRIVYTNQNRAMIFGEFTLSNFTNVKITENSILFNESQLYIKNIELRDGYIKISEDGKIIDLFGEMRMGY